MIKRFNKYINIFIIIFAFTFVLVGCKSNSEIIQDYLNNNRYKEAVKKADSLTKDEDISVANNIIKNEIEIIRNRYINGEIDGTLAISDIEKLRSTNSEDINNTVDSVKEDIHMRMNSKKAFDDGVKFEKDGNYKEAIEAYRLVSENDTENYIESQSRINSIKEKLKQEEVLMVIESKVIVTSENNKDIYPDQLQLILKNNGEASIKKFEVTIYAYDDNNNPVKIKNKLSESEEYMLLGLADNININPGEMWGYNYAWTVTNNNIKRIEACIEYAEYEDDSTWENPLYMEWLRDHWVEE